MLRGMVARDLTHWAFACCRAVLLQRLWRTGVVVDRADKLDGSVLQTVMVDEEALIKVNITAHLLGVVLVEQPYISVQITLVVDAVEALAGSNVTETVTLDALGVANTLVGRVDVLRDIYVVLDINLIFNAAEALQARLGFHL